MAKIKVAIRARLFILTTKKSFECKAIIQKHSKDFGGSLEDPDVIKFCGCSRSSYYKYKGEIKSA